MLRGVGNWSVGFWLILLCLGAPAVSMAAQDSAHMKIILVLGDSLSDGFGLRRNEAYPALLVEKLRTAGLKYEVINASQSGGTTEGGLRRLPPHLKRPVDIFILQLGVNDLFRSTPIPRIRANLQTIMDQVRSKNADVRIIIAGLEMPNYSAQDYVAAFIQMYADLAEENGATLVPSLLEGVAGNPDLNLPDGLHPNAAGQKILAQTVWRYLEPIAREVASAAAPAHDH
jgi:acyl-CoA thioesterase I